MNQYHSLCRIVVAFIIMVFAGPFAVAQVQWNLSGSVVGPGDPGAWNDSRATPGDVVFDGMTYHLFLVGGQTPLSWDSPWSVGHWTSDDLKGPWAPDPANPVLQPEPGRWDGYTIYNIAVLYDGVDFRMWYGAAASYLGVIGVGYADSFDGSTWTKHPGNPLTGLEPGLPGAWDDWGLIPSTVLDEGAFYRMWFTAFEYAGGSIDVARIGAATSVDGITWSKQPQPVLVTTESWEGDLVFSPEVVPVGDGYAMWYSGLAWASSLSYVGFAVSPDGLHWGKWPENPVLSPLPGCNAFDNFAVLVEGGTIHGWGAHCYEIYHADSAPEVLSFDGFESGNTIFWDQVLP